jgi:hypothetical protein
MYLLYIIGFKGKDVGMDYSNYVVVWDIHEFCIFKNPGYIIYKPFCEYPKLRHCFCLLMAALSSFLFHAF